MTKKKRRLCEQRQSSTVRPRQPGSLDAASLERDQIYAGSVRRHCEAERREILQDHLRYHEKMVDVHTRNLERIIERHRERAEECERMLRILETNDERNSSS